MAPAESTGMEWVTPVGKLTLAEDGSIRATIRHSPHGVEGTMTAVQAVTTLKSSPFLPAIGFQQDDEGFALSWPAGAFRSTALSAMVAGWRQTPAIHIPDTLHLVQDICRASSELDHLRPQRFLLSPAQVFLCQDDVSHLHWGVVVLPLEGARYADFASASPGLLAWVSADEILQATAIDRIYLIGAILYYCLVGELFPEGLSRRERLGRLLLYRVGNAARAKSVLSGALPKSLAGLGLPLAEFIVSLLEPTYGRKITPARAMLELDHFQKELAAPRLAAAWEAEGNINVAATILNAFAKRAPKSEVPWKSLVRLRALTGDTSGSTEAALNLPRTPLQEEATFIGHLRELAGRGAEGRAELERAASRLKRASQSSPPLSDQEFLYLVYVSGRWLSQTQESLDFLKREFPVSWHKIVSAMLVARLSADQCAWGNVVRSCRDCRRLIDKLPDKGSAIGRYAHAYVDVLDAIAHIRAVEGGMSDAYLEDALVKFENAWSQLREFAGDDLEPVIESWLVVLTRQAAARPTLDILRLGAEAFCQSLGMERARSEQDLTPPIPWFSEDRVFVA